MDILDPCSDDDINNDVNSLYVEIIDKVGWKLSRKQRLLTLLSYVHGKGGK